MKKLLSGNEAVARGIYESGVMVAAGYPGTPSTEILENLARYKEVYAEWSSNEKVALDVAIGTAYAGRRAVATMKHVGLNVASESLFYASYTGIEAGLVIVTADDPGLHSSQNEQDNRHYARFAKVPMLEPSDSQECKDFVGIGLEISEQYDTPVLLRTTTRVSHASSVVEIGERQTDTSRNGTYKSNPQKYVMIPAYAKRRHPVIEARMAKLTALAESLPQNRIEMRSTKLGIITSGISYQYVRDVFPDASILKLGMVWPLPSNMIRTFASQVDRLIVVEELDPFLEENVRLLGLEVEGKKIFPIIDEFAPEIVRRSAYDAGLKVESPLEIAPPVDGLPMRPPVLCAGCPHRNVFLALKKLKLIINSDIGCYALGVLPPLESTDTIGAMGASIGVAHGIALAGLEQRNVAVIGDSTFFHAGLAALANTVYNRGTAMTIIVDNHTTAMTGHQGSPATGVSLQNGGTNKIAFEPLARAMGVDYVETVDPMNLDTLDEALRRCLKASQEGQTVVLVADAPCVFAEDAQAAPAYHVELEDCNGCTLCFRIGCPAIYHSEELDEKHDRPKAYIDPALCFGCDLCAQVCARGAILPGMVEQSTVN